MVWKARTLPQRPGPALRGRRAGAAFTGAARRRRGSGRDHHVAVQPAFFTPHTRSEIQGVLRLAESKTGAKLVYLNAPAREVLANLPRLKGNPYVIIGEKKGAHLVNLEKPWRRVRKAAGLDDVRLHDLRHSFASMGAAGGMSLPLIGKLLGHSQAQTTHRYAHLADDPVRQASEAVAARIAAAMAKPKGKARGNVVKLHATRT